MEAPDAALEARLAQLEARLAQLEAAQAAGGDAGAPAAAEPGAAASARYLGVQDEIAVDSAVADGAHKSLDLLEHGVLGLHNFKDGGPGGELALEEDGEGTAKTPAQYSAAVRNASTGELEWKGLRVPIFECPYAEEEGGGGGEGGEEEPPWCGNPVNGRPGYDDDVNPLDR